MYKWFYLTLWGYLRFHPGCSLQTRCRYTSRLNYNRHPRQTRDKYLPDVNLNIPLSTTLANEIRIRFQLCLVPRRRCISSVKGGKTGSAGLDGPSHNSTRTAHDQGTTPGYEADPSPEILYRIKRFLISRENRINLNDTFFSLFHL